MKLGLAVSLLIGAIYFSGLLSFKKVTPVKDLIVLKSQSSGILNGRLPDNSTVVLTSNSELSYHKDNWNRNVNLKGEAYFNVSTGSKFSINTTQGVVSVIGTEFQVKSNQDVMEVICTKGVVQVEGKKYKEVIKANETMKLFTDGRSVTKLQFITKMQNVILSDVLSALAYQYNREITHEGINVKKVVTSSFTHTDLQSALKNSVGSMGLKYDLSEPGKIKLFK